MHLNSVDTLICASGGIVCGFVNVRRTLPKQILIWFIAEEHIKFCGRLNTITIINCLTKADLKFLYPFPSLAD